MRVLRTYTTLAQNYAEDIHSKKTKALELKLSRMKNFCIIFDEADFHGEKFFIFLISELSNEGPQKPHLLDSTIGFLSSTATTVRQKVVAALSNYKILENFDRFEVFLTDGAAHNILAGKQLKDIYSKTLQITCVSHMLARVATVILEQKLKTKTRSLLKAFIKIFKSSTDLNNWKKFDGRTLQAFPMPCGTRWGTLLSCVAFLTQNIKLILAFLKTLEQRTYVEKTVYLMGDSALITEMEHIYSLEFVKEAITLSEASNFSPQKLKFCSNQFFPD